MAVAVVAVRVVQLAVDEVVDVVAVRDRVVAAAGAVDVVGGMSVGRLGVLRGVGRVDGDRVLVDVVLMRMMQMTVVNVVDVALVADGRVPAARAVHVVVVGMGDVIAHGHTVCPLARDREAGESENHSFLARCGTRGERSGAQSCDGHVPATPAPSAPPQTQITDTPAA